MKSIVKKCTAMAGGKAVMCRRCGFVNGLDSIFYCNLNIILGHDVCIIFLSKEKLVFGYGNCYIGFLEVILF